MPNPTAESATRSWILYDVGNSAFATTFMAAILPIWFSQGLAADLDPAQATRIWGWGNSLAMAGAAVLAPILGALADSGGQRGRLLGVLAWAGAVFAAGVALCVPGQWALALVLFLVARIFFAGSIVCYDGLLPHVAAPDQRDSLSARGYAWGYLSGGLLLAVQLLAIQKPELFGLPSSAAATRLSLLVAALWWAAFTWPVFHSLPPLASTAKRAHSSLGRAFRNLWGTAHELRKYREAWRFLLAFWFYNDGIGTVVIMATVLGSEMGLGQGTLIGALLLVQLLGFPAALAFGKIAGKIGPRPAIVGGLCVYLVICLLALRLEYAWQFWALAAGVALVQGGTQALSRSLFARLVPDEKSGEFFGFFGVSSKFASVTGPALFAVVGRMSGDNRMGALALALFFLIGIALLLSVRLPEEKLRR